jgi:hypothetical protein
VRPVHEFLQEPPAELTAYSTDAEIDSLAATVEDEAESEGVVLDAVSGERPRNDAKLLMWRM